MSSSLRGNLALRCEEDVMKKITKKIFVILRFLTVFVVVVSLAVLFIDTVKYSGFTQKHFFIDALTIFGIGIFLIYTLLVLESPKNYWWTVRPWKLIQTQSVIVFPLSVVLYIILLSLESLNYPNYVFSMYSIDLIAFTRFIFAELVLFLMPFLATQTKKYLEEIAKELKLSEVTVGFGFMVLFVICLVVRMI
jgi:hypothetical protein